VTAMGDPNPRAAIEDTLYVACCRPAMMLGVPAEGLMLNLCGSVIASAWAGMHSWHMLAYMAASVLSVHMVMRFASARDHNWFRVFQLGAQTKGFGTARWGGSTLTPIPAKWPGRARDLSIDL